MSAQNVLVLRKLLPAAGGQRGRNEPHKPGVVVVRRYVVGILGLFGPERV